MPETFDILTAIKSTYPSIQKDFRRSYPKASAEEVDSLIGRFFYDTMLRPEKNTDPQARQKFIRGLVRSPHIPVDWKADGLIFVKNITQEAFRFTPRATYAQQEPLQPLLEEFLPIKQERKARETALLKASEYYPKKGTRAELLHLAKIEELKKPGAWEKTAKDLSFVADTWRNVLGQYMAPFIRGIPKVGEQAAIAMTPRVNFATEISKKYGPWATIPYTIAEVGVGFLVPSTLYVRGLGLASKIPGVAGRVAKFTLTHPTLQNATFLGGYSGADYLYRQKQAGEEPTTNEFLVHTGAGTVIGIAMPHVGRVFQNAAARRELGENIEMLLGKKIAKLRRMTDPQLRHLIRESHLPKSVREKVPPELLEKLKLPENLTVKRIQQLNKRGAVTQFLGQSIRSGAVGGGVQIGQDMALGLPVDLPSVAHNAAMMMGFHASGLVTHAPKAVRPKDGIADLSTPQGKGIVGKSIKFLLSSPDMAPEQVQAKFVENLAKNKVDVIRTVEGEVLRPKEVFAELNRMTEPGSQSLFDHLALAYREYGKAMVVRPQTEFFGGMNRLEVRTVMRSRIDNLIASVGRRLGESTDVPSTTKPGLSAPKTNQDWYEWKLKRIAEEFGEDGVNVVTESLRVGMRLDKMKEPVARDILNRYPEMIGIVENYRRAMSEKVSERETQQQVMELREQEEGRRVEMEAAPEIRPPADFVVKKKGAIGQVEKYLDEFYAGMKKRGPVFRAGEFIVEYVGADAAGRMFNLFKIGKSTKPGTHIADVGDHRIEIGGTIHEREAKILGIEIPLEIAKVEVAKKVPGTPEGIEQTERIKAFMAQEAAKEKPTVEAKPLQPVWEPGATFEQRQAIDNLRAAIKIPSHRKKLKTAIDVAREEFKGARGEMLPSEIAEAERLLRIEKGKKELVARGKRPKPKYKPEEVSKRIEEVDEVLTAGKVEVAEKLFRDMERMILSLDARTKEGKRVLDRLGEVARKLSKEVEDVEVRSVLAREHHKVGDAIEHFGSVGLVAKGLKGEEYLVYFPTEEVATRVHWTQAEPSTLKEAVRLSVSLDQFQKAGKEAGMTRSEIDNFIDKVEGNGKLGIVIGVDPAEIAKLAGKAASKVSELFRRKPATVGQLASAVELYRYRRYQRRHGSVLARFFQFAVFGDPMKEATKKQVRDIEKAIDQNETNPFMGAEPHLIDPTDFMVKVLGRTNWSRIMAKEGGQPYQPMNRLDAQRLLKEFAKISVAIRDKNFALASNVGLPLAISESTPRTRQAYEGMTIATSKRNSRMADVYELANDINVIADRKARKFVNPKTGSNINREVADILQGFVKWNDPNLMHESREIANIFRRTRFREKFWDVLNNVHNFRTLPKLRGSLMNDRSRFIDFWVERGLNAEKVTPENAEVTRDRLESEAGRIFDNPEKRKEVIDDIIEENKLGKIISKQGMNLYYPGYAKKLTEVLREKAQKLEEGGYVKGGYGGIIFEHARKLTLEERKAHPELYKEPNVVDDFLTYGLDVLALAYRADMDFNMWRATKQIKLDMEKAPKYAKRFAHDLEFIESLRDRVLNPPRNIGRRISGNIAALTSVAILPGLRTVFRNITGGTGMTYVWSGSKSMAKSWEAIRSGSYRGISVPKIIKIIGAEYQELIEGGLAKVKTKPTEVMPKGFQDEMSQWSSTVLQYGLSRVMPLVPDVWPWFAQVTKRMTFAGSEGLLRPTAGMAGFVSTYETVLSEGAKYRRGVRIFGDSASELATTAKKKYGETISENLIQERMKPTKSPKAQNKYAFDINVKENDKQLNQRAFREALKGARETIMWTQFLYGAINTPKLMAHPLGRVILVLRKYTWNKAMVGLRVMRELPPSKGGGSEEWARFMRYVGVVGISTALSKALQINIGRYFEDDFLEMLGSVKAMIDGVPVEEAFWGRGPEIWLAGAAIGRNMDILAHSQGDRAGPEMNKSLELILANSPYGKPIIDAWREYVKVTEYGKNVFEALANNLIGLMREYRR